MGNLSDHFDFEEFHCNCHRKGCAGKTTLPKPELIALLEAVRARVGKIVVINCGVRCDAHNLEVGGKTNSRHLPVFADAADIRVPGMSASDLYAICDRLVGDSGGAGSYPNQHFVHVDTRGSFARWTEK